MEYGREEGSDLATIRGAMVYAVRCSVSDYVAVFTSLQNAFDWCEEDRPVENNPRPHVWNHMMTDMRMVELWETTYILFNGDTASLVITKYPLDMTPDDLM